MLEKTRPITPGQARSVKKTSIPNKVIASFNELIGQTWNGDEAKFKQDDVVSLIIKKMKGISHEKIFKNGWLDVEEIYRQAGWKVEYDKPGFNETYPATFTFRPKRRD